MCGRYPTRRLSPKVHACPPNQGCGGGGEGAAAPGHMPRARQACLPLPSCSEVLLGLAITVSTGSANAGRIHASTRRPGRSHPGRGGNAAAWARAVSASSLAAAHEGRADGASWLLHGRRRRVCRGDTRSRCQLSRTPFLLLWFVSSPAMCAAPGVRMCIQTFPLRATLGASPVLVSFQSPADGGGRVLYSSGTASNAVGLA